MITCLFSAALRGVGAQEVEVEGIRVYPIRNLREAWDQLNDDLEMPPFRVDRRAFFDSHRKYEVDFDEVRGQHMVKRALEVAAAGNHSILKL